MRIVNIYGRCGIGFESKSCKNYLCDLWEGSAMHGHAVHRKQQLQLQRSDHNLRCIVVLNPWQLHSAGGERDGWSVCQPAARALRRTRCQQVLKKA